MILILRDAINTKGCTWQAIAVCMSVKDIRGSIPRLSSNVRVMQSSTVGEEEKYCRGWEGGWV